MTRAVVAAALVAAACAREDCPQPTPHLIADAGLGEPCGATGNCTPGLTCRAVYAVRGYESPSFTANACSTPCDAGCPGTSACTVQSAGVETCERTCTRDGDCSAGLSAGVCDGGRCERLQCTEDTQCPKGFACDIPAIVCCPGGGECIFAGKVAGYCRRT